MQHNRFWNSTDTVSTFHASIKATLIPQKLDFLFNGSYSYAPGRVERCSPNAPGSPVYNANQPNDLTHHALAGFRGHVRPAEAALQCHFTKSLTAKLLYAFESFTKDWQTDTSQPFPGPGRRASTGASRPKGLLTN